MKNRIKEIRKDANLTQQEFANRLGIKRNTIATYESGRNAPIDAVISLICREFKINEEWLRSGRGDKKQPEPKSEMDMLAKAYDMSRDERIFLEMYLRQSRPEREAIFNFLRSTFTAIENDVDEGATVEKNTVSEETSCAVKEAEAEYIKSRSKTAKKTGQYVLNTTVNGANPENISGKAANQ